MARRELWLLLIDAKVLLILAPFKTRRFYETARLPALSVVSGCRSTLVCELRVFTFPQAVLLTCMRPPPSKFHSRLKSDHARGAIAAQANTKQPRWRGGRVAQRSESCLCGRFAGDACIAQNGKAKVRMIEDIEKLPVDAQLHVFPQREPPGYVKIAPREVWAAECIAAEIAKLAVLRSITAHTRTRAWIYSRDKGVGIEPLNRSRLRDARNSLMRVQRHAGNDTGVLGATALHDAISIGRIRCAENRERNPAVPEHRSGYLPAVQRIARHLVRHLDRQLIHILRREIMAHIVIARAILASQFSGQGRDDPPRGEG